MDIRFPNLNLVFSNVGTGITIFGFEIKFYGMIIAVGFLAGLLVAQREARRTGQDPEIYLDYLLTMVIPAIVGARLYYVVFSWDYYKDHLNEILLTRNGGLAIYGGILAALLMLVIFCKVRKYSPLLMADTAVMGLLIGQIFGRWGNFFNREAFGGYTDGLFAMQIPLSYFHDGRIADLAASGVYEHLVTVGNQSYIQVHPTFLYECLWNIGVLLFLLWFRKRKKWDGQMLAVYFIGYGSGRFLIEGLRTDSLYFMGTGIRVSQMLALILVVLGIVWMIKNRKIRAHN
ncbi:MAG TPA: prolipoprotein diacylglyceryl transferase [Candidatus Fimousia stercorigallinarum]|nr:prolipoprotein diacylglyceryl transferase [Candidatus Fimousia stercorigallinarum]